MILSLFGLAAGIGMPIQTSINAQLGRRAGSPFMGALLNFIIGLGALLIITVIVERSLMIPIGEIISAPPWILLGGCFAVVFVTGNILLMPRIGSVQTAILPAMGQILMGTLIDTFGWFQSAQRAMSLSRILGVALVVSGVLLIVLTKAGAAGPGASHAKAGGTPAKAGAARSEAGREGSGTGNAAIWLWRTFGVITGMCMASQTAVNSHLGLVVDSRLYASIINFTVGTTLLVILNLLLLKTKKPWNREEKAPLWIWTGGLFGALFVVGNIITAQTVGTGMAVVILLTGLMIGGLLVDQFGMFRSKKRPVSVKEILGVALMVCGAVLFHLS